MSNNMVKECSAFFTREFMRRRALYRTGPSYVSQLHLLFWQLRLCTELIFLRGS